MKPSAEINSRLWMDQLFSAMIDARGLQDRLKLAVGGAVFNWRPYLIAEVGGDGTGPNAAGVDALFLRLQSEAKGGSKP
jgi:hypothetical protein